MYEHTESKPVIAESKPMHPQYITKFKNSNNSFQNFKNCATKCLEQNLVSNSSYSYPVLKAIVPVFSFAIIDSI